MDNHLPPHRDLFHGVSKESSKIFLGPAIPYHSTSCRRQAHGVLDETLLIVPVFPLTQTPFKPYLFGLIASLRPAVQHLIIYSSFD
jgi:hypothetical protein